MNERYKGPQQQDNGAGKRGHPHDVITKLMASDGPVMEGGVTVAVSGGEQQNASSGDRRAGGAGPGRVRMSGSGSEKRGERACGGKGGMDGGDGSEVRSERGGYLDGKEAVCADGIGCGHVLE